MAAVSGYLSVQIVDNGGASIVVPAQSVQLVVGTAQSGTVGQIVATKNPATLLSTFGYGPLGEAAALSCLGGATVLAILATTATAATKTSVVFVGSGTSVITLTGTPLDTYYFSFTVANGGTIATAGITFTISLDAGRTQSPAIALGTATTYAIPGTGLTLNFAAGTLVANDNAKASTTEPLWNTAGILAALQSYAGSVYATNPIGSMHLVGGSTVGGVPGADATTIEGYLDGSQVGATNVGNPLFNAAIVNARDAHPPATYGGAGETEQTWMTAIETDYSAVSAKRLRVCAAHWNMPSALANPLGMFSRFRRPLAFAAAQRKVAIQPQQSLGRVRGFGPLGAIVINAATDPSDGFIYHNDANFAPAGLGDFRFTTSTLRSGSQAVFIRTDLTMASLGSQYAQGPLIDVANFASVVVQQTTQELINDNVRLLTSGTLDPRDAAQIQTAVSAQIAATMTSQQMISSATVVADTTNNVQSTGNINVTTTLVARGIVLSITNVIQYSNPNQAQAA